MTGASSGIGLAFAESLAGRGHPLLLVARRESRLRDLAARLEREHGVVARVAACDLATAQGRARCRDAVDASALPPEVAVLNAGFGSRGPVASLPASREVAMVELNCVAVVDLATFVLPGMVERGRGDVVVVSSAASFQPLPGMATYAATKAFELRWAEALHAELRGTGVRAIAVCPGPTRTEFDTAAGSPPPPRLFPMETADGVVADTWRALARGRRRVCTSPFAALVSGIAKVVPGAVLLRASSLVVRPRGSRAKRDENADEPDPLKGSER